METRRLAADDREALARLRSEFFPQDTELEWPLREMLASHNVVIGAYDGEALVGYASAGLRSHAEGAWERPAAEQRIAYLEEWFVTVSHRGRGIGRALVDGVEAWARELRADLLASDTELDNDQAAAAHVRLGFEEVERSVHFVKKLQPAAEATPESAEITLRELDSAAGRHIMRLRVAPSQLGFVAPNTVSLAEAGLTDEVITRGIYADDKAVGFAMVSTRNRHYYLWRFMIDQGSQGRGYGRRAMELIIDLVRTLPDARQLFLSFVKAPGGPGPFYESLGFRETGEVHDGEHVMMLEL